MPPTYVYHPFRFYLITILMAFIPAIAHLISPKDSAQFQLPLTMICMCMPCIIALIMIFTSHNKILVADFWKRLLLFKISPFYLTMVLFLMPFVVLLSTEISLLFGFSTDQFSLTKELSFLKGSAILGMLIPLLLAPLIEETGWRGYGVDSLRVYFNLFITSIIFGLLWAVWHLPLFFIKGSYQNELFNLGIIYVINFFVSVFAFGFLMNWVYYKSGRSIPVAILFHSTSNLSMMLWETEPFTKCITTALLGVIVILFIVFDRAFFFSNKVMAQK